jgi:exodeoxyribonuclease VII large subunit
VAELLRGVLADAVPAPLRVVGEVSNLSDRTHWFFSLKDEAATLRCVCFATTARRIGFKLQDGMEVVCSGRLDYYDAGGQLQLYVERIEPVGQGALELRYRALCEELRKLGYFAPERKKPLPVMPTRVAVVTSRTGAALQDVLNTARKRWPGCQLYLLDVHVQGAAAAPQIAAALTALSRYGPHHGLDAVILTRGGGSIEDLWAFNERVVADAIFRCPLPVVAAIGHETDVTIAELVADVRCATPTQAAMTLIPDAAALTHQVDQLAGRLVLLVRREIERDRQRLEALAHHPLLRRPKDLLGLLGERLNLTVKALHAAVTRRVQRGREQLDAADKALPQTLARRLQTQRERLSALDRHLQAVSPLNVLERGYSYTLGPDGHVLKNAAHVRPGDRLTTMLADGKVYSQVEGHSPGGLAKPAPPKRTKPRKTDDDTTQMDLFDGPPL